MVPLKITQQTLRRFILGRQGLWPGRRWRGRAGTWQAVRACEAVQIDPLNAVARSQDLVLHSRVLDYTPADLAAIQFEQRKIFDYGGTVYLYPMEELPYWRVIMERRRTHGFWSRFPEEHGAVLAEVQAALRARGPLGNRDFAGNHRVESYRARKDTGLALYYQWITGETMSHHRRGYERIFDFRENIVPAGLEGCAGEMEARDFFARKGVTFHGLATISSWCAALSGLYDPDWKRAGSLAMLREWVERGDLHPVQVEGIKTEHYALAEDLPLLETVAAGDVPAEWQPVGPTTEDEVSFLAPLDIVSARGRAKPVFNFDYVWEVYKPVSQRRWGYYTLPVLYGDRLVARIDPKLDRKSKTLAVNGIWLEETTRADDPDFRSAFALGLGRLAEFAGAERIDLSGPLPAGFETIFDW